jgi:hypothetical protein
MRKFLRLSLRMWRVRGSFGSYFLLVGLGESLDRRCFLGFVALVSSVLDCLFSAES